MTASVQNTKTMTASIQPTASLRKLLLPALTALLLAPFAALSTSSEAESPLVSAAGGIADPIWSRFSSCAVTGDDEEAIAAALENDSIPTAAARRNYSQCGAQALRAASGQLLLDTMEASITQGGLAAFSDGFSLDSSLSWVWGEDLQGDLDAVLPVWEDRRAVIFVQPGLAFWPGLNQENRTDANLGFVYRQETRSDSIFGASVFYDYDFQRGHRRAAFGMDWQSEAWHGGINYYHPLNKWREGREGRIEEQALRGGDLRLGIARDRIRLDGSVGYWRFEGERDDPTRWRTSYEVTTGYRIRPGVFLEGGYEHHDKDRSFGSRWNAGFAFRFSLPGLQGAEGAASLGQEPSLYRAVQREKRILYEERRAVIPAVASLALSESTLSEGQQTTLTLTLTRVLDAEAVLPVLFSPSGEASATPSALTIPVGETSAIAAVTATDDSIRETSRERVEITLDIPTALTEAIRAPEPAVLNIHPSDDLNVAFADTNRRVTEGDADADISAQLYIGDPAPAGGLPLALTSSDATDASVPATFTVPAGSQTASIPVTILADDTPEEEEEITITLAEGDSFPSGWNIGENGAFTLTIGASDNVVTVDAATPSGVSSRATTFDLVLDLANPAPSGGFTLNVATSDPRIRPTTHTVASGDATATIPVTVQAGGDVGAGGVEVTLTITAANLPAGWSFGAANQLTHTVTLRDLSIGFAQSTDRVDEPETNETRAIPVTILPAPTGTVTLTAQVDTDASTAQPADYTAAAQTLTFDADTTTQDFSITINADSDAEADEEIVIELLESSLSQTSPDAYPITTARHTITIPANDNEVAFAEAASTASEGDGTHEITVAITTDPANAHPTIPITLPLSLTAGTNANDFTGLPANVTIPANGTETSFTLTLNDDDLSDGSKTFTFTLDAAAANLPPGWTVGSQTTHAFTLTDNDSVISFMTAASEEDEPTTNRSVHIPVTIDPAPAGTVTIDVQVDTANTTAAVNADYTAPLQTLTFNPTTTTARFTVRLIHDVTPVAEDAETITLTLDADSISQPNDADNYSLGTSTHTLTITPNDKTLGFAASPGAADADEDAGTLPLTLAINFAAPSQALTIGATVSNGTNTGDFTMSGTIPANAAAGDQTDAFTIAITDDQQVELDETFTITLNAVTIAGAPAPGWSIDSANAAHTFTINDNDRTVQFASADGTTEVAEDDGGIAIELATNFTPATAFDITANITSTNPANDSDIDTIITGTIPAASDGNAALANAAGSELTVTILADNLPEPDEDFEITLNAPTEAGWGLGDNTEHTIRILANDRTVGFESPTSSRSEDAGAITIPLAVNDPPPAAGLPLTISVSGGSAQAEDYTLDTTALTITQETGNAISLTLVDDENSETAETVEITIAAGTNFPADEGWSITPATHTLTINDDDAAPIGFASTGNPETINEGATSGNFTVSTEGTITADFSITVAAFTVTNDTCSETAATGVTINNAPLEFTSTASTDTFTVTIAQDTTPEVDQQFCLRLSTGTGFPSDFTIQPSTTTITIPANDNFIAFGTDTNADNTIDSGSNSGTATETDAAVTHTIPLTITNPLPSQTILALTTSDTTAATITATDTGTWSSANNTLTLPAATTGTINLTATISPDDDATDETVTFAINAAGTTAPTPAEWGAITANTAYTLAITDDDTFPIGFAATGNPETIAEGATSPDFTVNTTGTIAADFQIAVAAFAVANDTCSDTAFATGVTLSKSNLDFTTTSSTDTFTVTVADDATPEDDQQFCLRLSTGSNFPGEFTIPADRSQATITIPANDKIIEFNTGHPDPTQPGATGPTSFTATEGDANFTLRGEANFDFPPTATPIILIVTHDDTTGADTGTSHARDIDHTGNITLRFANDEAGFRSTGLTFGIVDDDASEGTETITFTIDPNLSTLPPGWSIGANNTLTLTLNDNDGSFGFAQTESRQDEPDTATTIQIPVTITPAPTGTVTVLARVNFSGTTAEAPADYDIGPARTLTFNSTTTTQNFPLTLNGDEETEADETIEIRLDTLTQSSPDNYTITEATHTLTINTNDNDLGFASNGAFTAMEDAGTATLSLSLTNPAPAGGLPVTITPISAGAATFVTLANNGDFMIPAGTTGPHDISITVQNPDTAFTGAEQVDFILQAGDNFPAAWGAPDAANAAATLTINEDDMNSVSVGFASAADAAPAPAIAFTAAEADSLFAIVSIPSGTVAPSGGIPVTISLANADNSAATDATFGTDTNLAAGTGVTDRTLTIPVGETSASFPITITDDADTEPAETLTLTIAAAATGFPAGWNIGATSANLTIRASDPATTIGFAPNDSVTPDGATNNPSSVPVHLGQVPVRIAATGPAPSDVTLTLTVSTGLSTSGTTTATTANITIPQNQSAASATIYWDDASTTLGEDNTATLSATNLPGGWSIGSAATYTFDIITETNELAFATVNRTAPDGTIYNITSAVPPPGTNASASAMLRITSDDAPAPAGGIAFTLSEQCMNVTFIESLVGEAATNDNHAGTIPAGRSDAYVPVYWNENATGTCTITLATSTAGWAVTTNSRRMSHTINFTPVTGTTIAFAPANTLSGGEIRNPSAPQLADGGATLLIYAGGANAPTGNVNLTLTITNNGAGNASFAAGGFASPTLTTDINIPTGAFSVETPIYWSTVDGQVNADIAITQQTGGNLQGFTIAADDSGGIHTISAASPSFGQIGFAIRDTLAADGTLINPTTASLGAARAILRLETAEYPAPAGGLRIPLATTGVLNAPAAVTIPAGARIVDFPVTWNETGEGTVTIDTDNFSLPAGWRRSALNYTLILGDPIITRLGQHTMTIAPNAAKTIAFAAPGAADSTGTRRNLDEYPQRLGGANLVLRLSEPAPEGGIHLTASTSNAILDLAQPQTPPATAVTTLDVTVSAGHSELIIPVYFRGASSDAESVTIAADSDNPLPAGWSIGARNSHSLRIDTTDTQRLISLANTAATIREGESADVTIQLNQPAPAGGLTVRLALAGGAASNGDVILTHPDGRDHLEHLTEGNCGTTDINCLRITIAEGEDSVTVQVAAVDDKGGEPLETHTLNLQNDAGDNNPLPANWFIADTDNTFTVTIPANDNVVGFSSSGTPIDEGSQLTVSVVTENLSAPLPLWLINDRPEDVDFGDNTDATTHEISLTGNTVTFNLRATSDALPEPLEVANITLTADNPDTPQVETLPEGWSLGRREYAVSVRPNSAPTTQVGFAQADNSTTILETHAAPVAEGDMFTLRIKAFGPNNTHPTPSAAYAVNVAATYAGTTDDASADVTVANNINFNSGINFQHLDVMIDDDDLNEADETITLTLSADTDNPLPSGWSIADATYTIAIGAHYDTIVRFATGYITATEGQTLRLPIRFPAVPTEGDLVLVADVPSDAAADVSVATATITPAADATTAVLEVAITDDALAEDAETFEIDIGGTGSTFPAGWGCDTTEQVPDPDNPGSTTTATTDHCVVAISIKPSDNTIAFADADIAPVTTEHVATQRLDPDNTPLVRMVTVHLNGGDANLPGAPRGVPAPASPGGIHLELTSSSPAVTFPNGATSGTLTIDPGTVSGQLALAIHPQHIHSENQTVTLSMVPGPYNFPAGWSIIPPGTKTITLNTPPANPTPTIGFAESYLGFLGVSEGQGSETVNLTLNTAAPAGGLTLAITSGDTSRIAVAPTITIPEGATEASFPITIRDGEGSGLAGTLLTLAEHTDTPLPGNWQLGDASLLVHISDNDRVIYFTESGATVTEGDMDSVDTTVTVKLSDSAPSGGLTVNARLYTTDDPDGFPADQFTVSVGGTAVTQTPGTPPTAELTFNEGDTEQSFTIALTGDTTTELFHKFIAVLEEHPMDKFPAVGESGDNLFWAIDPLRDTFTLNVYDNDGQTIAFDAANSTTETFEGDLGASITLALSAAAPTGDIYAGRNDANTGNLTGGIAVWVKSSSTRDIQAQSSFVVIPAGVTSFEVPLNVHKDDVIESASETITFTLTRATGTTQAAPDAPHVEVWPAGWRLGDPSTHTITILPDSTPSLGFAEGLVGVPERIGTTNLRVDFTQPAPAGGFTLAVSAVQRDAGRVNDQDDTLGTGAQCGEGNSAIGMTCPTEDITVPATVAVAEGATFVDIPVTVVNDWLTEGYEIMEVTIADHNNSIPADWRMSRTTQKVAIYSSDNRQGAVAGFSFTEFSLPETNGNQLVAVGLTHPAPKGGLTVEAISSHPDDATLAPSTTIFFAEGETIVTGLTVAVTPDDIPEEDEVVTFSLRPPENGTLPGGWGIAAATINGANGRPHYPELMFTITDDEPELTFTLATTELDEGASCTNTETTRGTIRIDGATAPQGGFSVNVVSSNTAAVTVMGSPVRFGTGAGNANFTLCSVDNQNNDSLSSVISITKGTDFPANFKITTDTITVSVDDDD